MSRLNEQMTELDRELDLLLDGDDNRKIIKEIESALDELERSNEITVQSLNKRRTLEHFPQYFSLKDCSEQESRLKDLMAAQLTEVVNAWNEDRAQVRQSGKVGSLAESSTTYGESLAEHNRENWNRWVSSLAADFSIVDAQLESIKNVPAYVQPIDNYKQGKEEFLAKAKDLPDSRVDVERLFELAQNLISIKDGLTFDLPPKILNFFDTLDKDHSFPLSRFDSDLSDWLLENDAIKDFAIVRRRVYR